MSRIKVDIILLETLLEKKLNKMGLAMVHTGDFWMVCLPISFDTHRNYVGSDYYDHHTDRYYRPILNFEFYGYLNKDLSTHYTLSLYFPTTLDHSALEIEIDLTTGRPLILK